MGRLSRFGRTGVLCTCVLTPLELPGRRSTPGLGALPRAPLNKGVRARVSSGATSSTCELGWLVYWPGGMVSARLAKTRPEERSSPPATRFSRSPLRAGPPERAGFRFPERRRQATCWTPKRLCS
jgi:hypothetical protein